ncbi:hypothetical protein KAR91_61150 [Candidatus Pacearchaeota archaeon]|nr:hypothetical protein [Candidatus Pacearchaeota archaeon]
MTLEEIKKEKDKLQNDINIMLCEFSGKVKDTRGLAISTPSHIVPTENKGGCLQPLTLYLIVG